MCVHVQCTLQKHPKWNELINIQPFLGGYLELTWIILQMFLQLQVAVLTLCCASISAKTQEAGQYGDLRTPSKQTLYFQCT